MRRAAKRTCSYPYRRTPSVSCCMALAVSKSNRMNKRYFSERFMLSYMRKLPAHHAKIKRLKKLLLAAGWCGERRRPPITVRMLTPSCSLHIIPGSSVGCVFLLSPPVLTRHLSPYPRYATSPDISDRVSGILNVSELALFDLNDQDGRPHAKLSRTVMPGRHTPGCNAVCFGLTLLSSNVRKPSPTELI